MKLKETIMIAVGALAFMLITGIAISDEKTYTPQETIEAFASVPGKVSNHFKNEWQINQKNSKYLRSYIVC